MANLLARRLVDKPVISPAMLRGDEGANINGPSIIATPDWLPGRMGRYYLYFAHHSGTSIRLAYADDLAGPWRIYAGGTLHLDDAPGCRGHIASPDVHVDEARRRIVMYFHGPLRGGEGQFSFIAISPDGISFTASPAPLAPFYLRVIRYGAGWFGMSKGGEMFVADDWAGPFTRLPAPAFPMSGPEANGPGDVRHVALDRQENLLWVYFSRIGDAPERILRASIDLAEPREKWWAGVSETVLAPETVWEGAGLPIKPSRSGAAQGPENAFRDPALFRDGEHLYLLYSVAGEGGLGIAELSEQGAPVPRL